MSDHAAHHPINYVRIWFILVALLIVSVAGPMLGHPVITLITAFGIACVMLVAIVMVHWPHGFFMNWSGNQKGEGFEYHLLVLGIAITLIIVGAGAWSLDGALAGPR